MTKSLRVRLAGTRHDGPRGPMIETDDGKMWVLDLGTSCSLPTSNSIVVEGLQTGFDRLNVEWAGDRAAE